MLAKRPDDYKILFVVDSDKTYDMFAFASGYVAEHSDAQILRYSKLSDLRTGSEQPRVLFVDCVGLNNATRVYEFVNLLKDGYVSRPKQKCYKGCPPHIGVAPLHVVMLFHKDPTTSLLSRGRFNKFYLRKAKVQKKIEFYFGRNGG